MRSKRLHVQSQVSLWELWYKSFGYWSTEDLQHNHIFRFVDNAEAISKVEIKDIPQGWASILLMRQFDNLDFDNGPHSFTRVVLRKRLLDMAKGDDAVKRQASPESRLTAASPRITRVRTSAT